MLNTQMIILQSDRIMNSFDPFTEQFDDEISHKDWKTGTQKYTEESYTGWVYEFATFIYKKELRTSAD